MEEDIRELANAIYHEARGESRQGQIAVGQVIMNRVRDSRFPSSVQGVIWQRGQFSGIRYHEGWERFSALAREILSGEHAQIVGNALFFANFRVTSRGFRIGNHRFW
jgi:N-acetylmuramoyl-L-alanine amidase